MTLRLLTGGKRRSRLNSDHAPSLPQGGFQQMLRKTNKNVPVNNNFMATPDAGQAG